MHTEPVPNIVIRAIDNLSKDSRERHGATIAQIMHRIAHRIANKTANVMERTVYFEMICDPIDTGDLILEAVDSVLNQLIALGLPDCVVDYGFSSGVRVVKDCGVIARRYPLSEFPDADTAMEGLLDVALKRLGRARIWLLDTNKGFERGEIEWRDDDPVWFLVKRDGYQSVPVASYRADLDRVLWSMRIPDSGDPAMSDWTDAKDLPIADHEEIRDIILNEWLWQEMRADARRMHADSTDGVAP